jgi:hypothetical protein
MYLFWFQKPAGVRDPTLANASAVNLLFGVSGDNQIASRMCIHQDTHSCHFFTERSLNVRNMAFHVNDLSSRANVVVLSAVFIVFAAYAAIHMTAWNYDFPTPAERYLWRISCICILISSIPAPIWLLLVSEYLLDDCHTCAEVLSCLLLAARDLSKSGFWMFTVGGSRIKPCCVFALRMVMFLCWLFCASLLPLFLCSRIFIIIGSFISLRNVPEGVYVVVSWTDYIPHM